MRQNEDKNSMQAMNNEDQTFEALRRPSAKEIAQRINNMSLIEYMSISASSDALNTYLMQFGWTFKEYQLSVINRIRHDN